MNAKLLLIFPMALAVSLYASSPAENSPTTTKNQAQQKQPTTVALCQQSQGQKPKPDSPKTQTTAAKVEPQQKPQNSPGLRNQSKEGSSRLNTPVNASAFKADMTFEQALDALRNSTKPPLKIIVLWRQLEPAGIDPYTPIKTDAIYGEHSRTINGLSIKNTLNILLASVSAGPSKLVWSARDGTIVIGLKKSNGNKKTCLYNVADLTSAPSNAAANPYGYNGFNQSQNPGLNNSASAAGGNRLQQSAYGGASNSFYSPITSISSGTSLGTGAGFGGMGGMGYGGMGFGGGFGQMGFGGMGLNSTVDTPLQQQIRQQQLKTLLQSSIAPGSWQ